jgi:hypothetical protein
MSNHKVFRIQLTDEERSAFKEIIKGKRGRVKIAVWKVQRANALLMCDESEYGPAWPDHKIAEAFATTTRSIESWRKKAALDGPMSVLERKSRKAPPTPPTFDGEKEAKLTKLACSQPVRGRSKWTLRLLAEELVRLDVVDSVSHETVRRTMKKKKSNLGCSPCGAFHQSKTRHSPQPWSGY